MLPGRSPLTESSLPSRADAPWSILAVLSLRWGSAAAAATIRARHAARAAALGQRRRCAFGASASRICWSSTEPMVRNKSSFFIG